MKISAINYKDAFNLDFSQYDGMILPAFKNSKPIGTEEFIQKQIDHLERENIFKRNGEEIYRFNIFVKEKMFDVFLLGLGDQKSAEELFYSFSKAFCACRDRGCKKVLVYMDRIESEVFEDNTFEKITESAFFTGYHFDKYRKVTDVQEINEIVFICNKKNLQSLITEAEKTVAGVFVTKDLINEPAVAMTPEILARKTEEIFADSNVTVDIYDKKELEFLEMNAFLAVGKGSVHEPKMIVIHYTGNPQSEKITGLVGKGVTYDSGGYSIQSSGFMETMQCDMSGGAAVIGAIKIAADMNLAVNVIGVIAACENKISGGAYVPGDIVKSMSGKFIEVNNTDAEGRITLADALTFLQREYKVERVIDIATLTDGIQVALGNRRAGIFLNEESMRLLINKASNLACERVWELPCDENLRRVLDSRVADLKNSAQGSDVGGYSTIGALFVKEFVENIPWTHIDIGGTAWTKEEEYHYTKGAVGFGTRLLYNTLKLLSDDCL